jgi:hypothetical protein
LNVTDAIIHFIGDGSALSHLNASNVDFGTLSTSVFPASGVTAGTYGSSSNVSQVTVDTYGRVTSATNVAITSSQWTGAPGSPIYYIPGVGIGSSIPATANLQVTGNVYVSNSITTTNVYAATEILTGATDQTTLNVTGNVYVSNAVTTTNVYAATEILTGATDQTTLNVTGNVYVSNSITTTNVYAATEILTGATDQTTLNVTGNVYVSNAVTTTNVNITDTLDVVGSMTANAANATFFFDTFTIPYINTQELNVASNIVLTGNLSAPLANITTLNVNYLTVDSAVVYGTSTLNVYGVSNLSTVTARTMNVYGDCFIGNTAITGSVQTTTGPMSRLTFDNTANTSIYPNKIVLYANTASSQYCGFGVTGLGPTGGASISYGARASHIFYTGTTLTTEVMRITSGSTVGVGTTTPTAKFHVVGNIYASNALTTTNVFATTANITTTNTQTLTVTSNMTFTGPLATFSNLYVPGNANIEYLSVSNLSVTGNLYVTATNVQTTNALTINNSGTMTAFKVTQNETSIHTHNVAEFWDATTLAMVIDPEGNVAIHTVSSPGYALTVTDPANFETLYIRGKPGVTSLDVTGNIYASNSLVTTNVLAATELLTGASGQTTLNVTGNIYASNSLTTTNLFTAGMRSNVTSTTFNYDNLAIPFITCATLNVESTSNLDVVTITGEPGLTSLNVTGNIYASNALVTTNIFANREILAGTTGQTTLNVTGNIYASNSLTTTNIFANREILAGTPGQTTLNVTGNIYASNAVTTTNVTVTGFLEADSTWMLGVSGTTQRTFRSGRVTGLSGVTDTVQGTATVTFGYTAASTNYRVIATVDGLTSAFPFAVAVSNKTVTTFDVRVLKINSTGASTVAVDWLLIE